MSIQAFSEGTDIDMSCPYDCTHCGLVLSPPHTWVKVPGLVGPEKLAGVYPVPLMLGQSVIAIADADGAVGLVDEAGYAEEADGLEDMLAELEAKHQ